MIYLASPYFSPQSYTRQLRYAHAMHVAAKFVAQGKIVYSPVVHFHPMSLHHNLPGDFYFWEEINIGMLKKADELYVLQLDGWRESIGLNAEIEFAHKNSIPVTYLEADEWLK